MHRANPCREISGRLYIYPDIEKRFGVFAIDFGLFFVLGMVLMMLLSSASAVESETLFYLVSGVLWWLYNAYMESSKHQGSLGKLALGIKVTDMNGHPISFGKASIRHFAKFISGFILLLGFIMAAFTRKKQALHDIIARCLVVKK